MTIHTLKTIFVTTLANELQWMGMLECELVNSWLHAYRASEYIFHIWKLGTHGRKGRGGAYQIRFKLFSLDIGSPPWQSWRLYQGSQCRHPGSSWGRFLSLMGHRFAPIEHKYGSHWPSGAPARAFVHQAHRGTLANGHDHAT